MSAAEVNFTFDGLHCMRDFGCIYIATGTSRTVSPATHRSEYSITGVSGSVELGDRATHDPYNLTGVLVPIVTPPTDQAKQELARRVAAWLKVGRRVLAWDYEPTRQHYAEVLAAVEWETRTWMDGGIAVTFRVQPYAYNATPTIVSKGIAAGTSTVLVPVSTVEPCPVCITVENTGSAPITRVRVSSEDGHAVDLAKGMSIAPGGTLRLDMEPPIGAAITTGDTAISALRYAAQFDQITLSGPGALRVTTDGAARVTVTARGRML